MRTLFPKFLLTSLLFIPVLGGAQQTALEERDSSTEEETETALRKDLVDEYYEKIRDLNFDYGKIGNVFSAVALLELRKDFKRPDFEILNGIDFQDLDGKKAGVLDLVVWDKEKKEAAKVFLVKASGNFPRALKIGEKQVESFKTMMEDRDIGDMNSRNYPFRVFRVYEFRNIDHFGLIGLKGTVERGWEREVDLTRDEAVSLQKWIVHGREEEEPETKSAN